MNRDTMYKLSDIFSRLCDDLVPHFDKARTAGHTQTIKSLQQLAGGYGVIIIYALFGTRWPLSQGVRE